MVHPDPTAPNPLTEPGAAAALVRAMPGDVVVLDDRGKVLEISDRGARLFASPRDRLIGTPLHLLLHPSEASTAARMLRNAVTTSGEHRQLVRIAREDGRDVRMMAHTTSVELTPGTTSFTVRFSRLDAPTPTAIDASITEWQLQVHDAVSNAAPPERSYDMIVRFLEQHLGAAVFIAEYGSSEGRWFLRLAGAPSHSGITGSQVRTERPVAELNRLQFQAVDEAAPEAVRTLSSLIVQEVERYGTHASPTIWSQRFRSTFDSRPSGWILVAIPTATTPPPEALELMRLAAHLCGVVAVQNRDDQWFTNQTLFDPLTGLAKRSLLVDRAEQAHQHFQEDSTPAAAIFVEVLEFHIVNSAFGHQIGDDVLTECADRIRRIVPDTDTVARFSGDEFAVLTHIEDPVALGERIFNALGEAFSVSESDVVHLQSRIGVARQMPDDAPDDLLRNAQTALMWSNQPGGSTVTVYDPALRKRSMEQMALRGDLRTAVRRGELRVHFQPKISISTGRIAGAEALLRWHHPTHGLLRPDRFIALAEESGIIVDIGAWVLREAIRQAATWRDRGVVDDQFLIAVNMSAIQLWSDTFASTVEAVLSEFNWTPKRLSLELTETLLVSNFEELLQALSDLKGMGVLLAADDFGTGYSALSYLDKLPLDVLKVDKGFVAALGPDGTGSVVASGVVSMARQLGLRTCAEGVENTDQLHGLRVLGCDWAQGYHIAKPLPADEFAALAVSGGIWI